MLFYFDNFVEAYLNKDEMHIQYIKLNIYKDEFIESFKYSLNGYYIVSKFEDNISCFGYCSI